MLMMLCFVSCSSKLLLTCKHLIAELDIVRHFAGSISRAVVDVRLQQSCSMCTTCKNNCPHTLSTVTSGNYGLAWHTGSSLCCVQA